MKYLPLIAALLTAATPASALDDGKGFEWIVRQGFQPSHEPSHGSGIEPSLAKLMGTIRGMPESERKDFLDALVGDTLDFAARSGSGESLDEPRLCIYLLEEFGSDKQKLEAFRNPEGFGTMSLVNSAAKVLATSTDPESVAILTRMAEAQFEKIDQRAARGPGSDEEAPRPGPPEVIFLTALVALNESISPAAPAVASRLHDQFRERYRDLINHEFAASIEKELGKARKVREKRLRDARTETRREPSADGNGVPEQRQEPAPAGAGMNNTPDASKWLWPSIGGGILALAAAWLALKKLSYSGNRTVR
ncbi:hypothetical protein [Luteolibacter sp. Populi]|uniref:hypothetical protein n=1 Tax=Luteolibacter sp. Populi TaxID=3230487 RepID=UPI003466E574